MGHVAKNVLVSGCMAYDTVLSLDGHLAPKARRDGTAEEMGFLVEDHRTGFGGCAANIAYGLTQLGVPCVPMAVVGYDFDQYRRYLVSLGVDLSRVEVAPDERTSNCTILTDRAGRQITAHYLGAAKYSVNYGIVNTAELAYGVVAPTNRETMQRHVAELAASSVPVLLQPGQVVQAFSEADFYELLAATEVLVANEHEASVMCERLAMDTYQLGKMIPVLVITRGREGSTVFDKLGTTDIEAYRAGPSLDSTGCGDAFVAGFLASVLAGSNVATAARLGTLVAGLNATQWGTQAYKTSSAEITSLFEQVHGYNAR
jgi:adenosine kinase